MAAASRDTESQPEEAWNENVDSDGVQPKRSRVCAVCAGPTETFHLNYGASTCFSCRAFFRRAIEKTRNPNFVCKKQGKCDIKLENRKSCRKCRFELCIKAGMKTGFVLDDGQKKVRFRKLIKRLKRERKVAGNKSRKAMAKEPDLPIKFSKKRESKCSKDEKSLVDNNIRDPLHDFESDLDLKIEDFHLEGIESLTPSISLLTDDSSQYDLEEMAEKILGSDVPPMPIPIHAPEVNQSKPVVSHEAIITADVGHQFNTQVDLSFLENETPDDRVADSFFSEQMSWKTAVLNHFDQSFAHAILTFHATYQGLTKEILRKHLISIASTFRTYACQNMHFCSIPPADQDILIKRNTPMFASLILAKYFGSSLGVDQVNWLLLGDSIYTTNCFIQPMSFHYVNSLLRLFIEAGIMHKYFSHVAHIGQSFKINSCWMGPLAQALLFYTDDIVAPYLASATKVHALFEKSVQKYCDNEGITTYIFNNLLKQLQEVTVLFINNVQWEPARESVRSSQSGYSCMRIQDPQLLTLEDEERWITAECDHVNSALKSVPFGEETLKECIMFNFDVPVSKTFMNKLTMTWIKRFTELVKRNEEFQMLTDTQQSIMLKASVLPAFAVALCHSENMATPDAQLEFGCGHQDMKSFVDGYKKLLAPGRKWRVMTFRDVNAKAKIYDNQLVEDYMSLVTRMSDFIMDSTVIRVLLLYVLFSSATDLFPGHAVTKVSKRYLNYLRKYFKTQTALGEERLQRGLGEVKVLTGMVKTICCP
ncbi:hypothetical protein TCAL_06377 [Tigriopus californicus]|uniref:Nuclear receptor domain-containing protein n=1 Tax=Tigriopus californicus TaxID=6832 RepID=A0A553PH54_TIGCA|nr:hypothetical protein TCAL_06377 [Tigriopus californicus]|eukprot:TCALIF_06377-PA protein Name:"Similar to thrb Thyroid hormone receptor beta (Paralichthys olivaceus)" AED:0.45 eAED:0.45 QI:0/-1/0/1/-1/1/1/0/762